MSDLGLIRDVEWFAMRAWPAAEAVPLDGWWLRHTAGVTRRANSVWPNDAGECMPLAEKLVRVEDFYQARGLPVRYQLCPAAQPAHLDARLAERGYSLCDRTAVQIASLPGVLSRTQPAAGTRVTVTDQVGAAWLAVRAADEPGDTARAAVLTALFHRIQARTGFALLQLEGEPAAVGLGVQDADWLGIFCMATRPQVRRRGAASAVLNALARWGHDHGAARMYLQVMEENEPARALYARAGFETLYHYYYRERRRL